MIRRLSRSPFRLLPVVLLLALHGVLLVSSTAQRSNTFDEMAHLTAGYGYWLTEDFRLDPENGILPLRWAALPLLTGPSRFPTLDQTAWRESKVWEMGRQFFFHLGNPLETLLLQGRMMVAVLSVALGALVWAWSRQLFGPTGGIISLILYAFSPAFLAHGGLVTTDVSVALFLTAAVWCVWRLLFDRVSPLTVGASILTIAGLSLSKASALVIVPIVLALAVFRSRSAPRPHRRQLLIMAAALAVVGLGVIVLIWACYHGRFAIFNIAVPGQDALEYPWDAVTAPLGTLGSIIAFLRDHRWLPEGYLYGIARAIAAHAPAFLHGQYSLSIWWYFFPYCFLVKSPLPLFAVLAMAVAALIRAPRRLPRRDLMPLWVLITAYSLVAMFAAPMNLGERHIMPVYPAIFVLAGASAVWLTGRSRAPRLFVLVSLITYGAASLSMWPHYLAYFNQLAGGPRHGYRHLVDSSLDWGQDLPSLRRWLERYRSLRQERPNVYLAYFGTASPAYYGIDAQPLASPFHLWNRWEESGAKLAPLAGGLYCISATVLQSVYTPAIGPWVQSYEQKYQELLAAGRLSEDQRELLRFLRVARLCAFLRQREPDDHVGYSILIYRLTDQEVHQALEGPPAELGLEISRALHGKRGSVTGTATAP